MTSDPISMELKVMQLYDRFVRNSKKFSDSGKGVFSKRSLSCKFTHNKLATILLTHFDTFRPSLDQHKVSFRSE
jgi:hypothetical protein